jgi:hypothetical protein
MNAAHRFPAGPVFRSTPRAATPSRVMTIVPECNEKKFRITLVKDLFLTCEATVRN